MLEDMFPEFVTVFTTQEKYGLPSSCYLYETQHPSCYNLVIVIEDKTMYETDDAIRAKEELPDVYLSGALHGDERVGPVSPTSSVCVILCFPNEQLFSFTIYNHCNYIVYI